MTPILSVHGVRVEDIDYRQDGDIDEFENVLICVGCVRVE